MSKTAVTAALESFFQRALETTDDDCFSIAFDPEWRSACELAPDPTDDISRWRPVRQSTPVDFSGLETALECPIHEDIKAYYDSFWSGNFEAKSFEGHVSLIQLWNQDDFDRLIANLVGHTLYKQRAKAPYTVFFANTDPDSELFLSIDNESGKVLLEEPGKAPIKTVDESVSRFLDRLTPLNATPAIY